MHSDMKRILYMLAAGLAALSFVSCDEFEPVFTGKYAGPEDTRTYTKAEIEAEGISFIPISDLKQMYYDNGSMPLNIKEDIAIAGQVTTSDEEGNFYRSFYIQDETSGIEIKIGLTGLYNEYKLGQWVYVKLNGLTLGDYHGSLQVGYEDFTGEYETAYMGVRFLVEAHVLKGEQGQPLSPIEITPSQMTDEELIGKYVVVREVTYTNTLFCLAYVDPNLNHKDQSNRIFLDEDKHDAWDVITWAMSDTKFEEYLNAGNFDTATTGDNAHTVAELRAQGRIGTTAYSVTQYFEADGKTVGVRTSGYSKFSDEEIPVEVRDGSATVDFTGILTLYDDEPQITLIDENGIHVNKDEEEDPSNS